MDEAVKAEIKRIDERLSSHSAAIQEVRGLVTTVNRLAVNMENMLKEMQKQSDRIDKLEQVPVDTAREIRRTAINTLVGVIVGALAVGLAQMIAQYL